MTGGRERLGDHRGEQRFGLGYGQYYGERLGAAAAATGGPATVVQPTLPTLVHHDGLRTGDAHGRGTGRQ